MCVDILNERPVLVFHIMFVIAFSRRLIFLSYIIILLQLMLFLIKSNAILELAYANDCPAGALLNGPKEYSHH